jgi:hypothetical protein
MPGFHSERPDNFSTIVAQEPLFSTFFPLGAACHRKIVFLVAAEPISPHIEAFPTFRSAFHNAGPWTLWDGEKEWRVSSLSPQQLKDYPPLGIWNDTLLIDRIVQDWRHEQHRVAV